MKEITFSSDDFSMFDGELTGQEYEFFMKHTGAFKRMMRDEPKEQKGRFLDSFCDFFIGHGEMRSIVVTTGGDNRKKFAEMFRQLATETFVRGKFSTSKQFVVDSFVVSRNKHMISYMDSRSYAKDPFFHRDTREVFRRLFGEPSDTGTCVKVICLLPLFVTFAGSMCRYLKKWLDANESPDRPATGSTMSKTKANDEEDDDCLKMTIFKDNRGVTGVRKATSTSDTLNRLCVKNPANMKKVSLLCAGELPQKGKKKTNGNGTSKKVKKSDQGSQTKEESCHISTSTEEIPVKTTEGKTTEDKTTGGKTTGGKTTGGKTTEGKTTEDKTTEDKRTEGKTTEGKTTEGKSTEGKSTEGKSTEGKSTEGKSTEGKSTEGKSTEGKSTQGKTTQGKTTQGKTTQGKTTESKPLVDQSSETKKTVVKTDEDKITESKKSGYENPGGKNSDGKNPTGQNSVKNSRKDKATETVTAGTKIYIDNPSSSQKKGTVVRVFMEKSTPMYDSDDNDVDYIIRETFPEFHLGEPHPNQVFDVIMEKKKKSENVAKNKERKIHYCAFCRKEEDELRMYKKCAKCKGIGTKFYCGRGCQRKDWPVHKLQHPL